MQDGAVVANAANYRSILSSADQAADAIDELSFRKHRLTFVNGFALAYPFFHNGRFCL